MSQKRSFRKKKIPLVCTCFPLCFKKINKSLDLFLMVLFAKGSSSWMLCKARFCQSLPGVLCPLDQYLSSHTASMPEFSYLCEWCSTSVYFIRHPPCYLLLFVKLFSRNKLQRKIMTNFKLLRIYSVSIFLVRGSWYLNCSPLDW